MIKMYISRLVGLVFSLLTQFTNKVYSTDVAGDFKIVEVSDYSLIGKDISQKILYGVVYWFFT